MLQFVDKEIEIGRGGKKYFHEHGKIARDAVAFHHVELTLNVRIKFFFAHGIDFDIDKSFYAEAEKFGIQMRVIPCDIPRFFKPIDTRGDCRRR